MNARCIVVPVAQPLLKLILAKQWVAIPCMGRWLALTQQLPGQIQESIIGLPYSDPPRPEDGDLSRGRLLSLIRLVQDMCPAALQQLTVQEAVEKRLEMAGAVSWLRNILANLPGDAFRSHRSARLYQSVFLVKSMLMSRLVPSYVCLKELSVNALQLMFPSLLDTAAKDLLNAKHVFPSAGSKHALRLCLDVALLLWRRRQVAEEPCVRFAGADSSPQHGFNWLLSSSFYVPKRMVTSLFYAVQRMERDAGCRMAGESWQQDEQSRKDHALLLAHLRLEHDIPVALGHSAESVAHKCAALLHKWALRVGSREALREFTSTFFSMCSDMGTELGVSQFRIHDATTLLPSWLLPDVMCADLADNWVDEASVGENLWTSDLAEAPQPVRNALDLPSQASQPENMFFLPSAIQVPGALHIVNNALKEVSGSMAYWETWFEQLKAFEALWSCGRLQRFINYCVRPSALHQKADELLRTKLGSLYMSRWNEVVRFCHKLSRVLPIIRCCWNERQFMQTIGSHGQKDSVNQFCPGTFTLILADALFFAYFDMVLSLTDVMESMGRWAESCPCHEDIELRRFGVNVRASRQSAFRQHAQALRGLFNEQTETCPNERASHGYGRIMQPSFHNIAAKAPAFPVRTAMAHSHN